MFSMQSPEGCLPSECRKGTDAVAGCRSQFRIDTFAFKATGNSFRSFLLSPLRLKQGTRCFGRSKWSGCDICPSDGVTGKWKNQVNRLVDRFKARISHEILIFEEICSDTNTIEPIKSTL